MAWETWLAFFAACWVISLSPGAGSIASLSSGLRYCFWRGYWNVLGLQLALALQIAIVAAGLGAVRAASELALNLIRWLGVGYRLYLGWTQRTAPGSGLSAAEVGRSRGRPLTRVLRGFLVKASNTKASLFIF